MNITKTVESHLRSQASLRIPLSMGLINLSALARRAQKELGLKKGSFNAVLAACRRYEVAPADDEVLVRLLKTARINVRSGLSMYALAPGSPVGSETLIQSGRGLIAVGEMPEDGQLLLEDISEISIVLQEQPESLSELIAFVHSLLAQTGVRIISSQTYNTKILLLLEKKYMASALAGLDI